MERKDEPESADQSGQHADAALANRESVIAVPSPDAPWYPDVNEFALTYNAYMRLGTTTKIANLDSRLRKRWNNERVIDANLDDVRCALFFQQR